MYSNTNQSIVVYVVEKGTRSDLYPNIARSRFLEVLMQTTGLPLTRISTNIEVSRLQIDY